MSYLLDKKIQRKKFLYILLSLFVFLILFYFRLGIWNGLSSLSHTLLRPVLFVGNNIKDKLGGVHSFFSFKNSLYLENQNLKSSLSEDKALMSNYNSVLAENISLKEILGRKNQKISLILGVILAKPNRSLYDTLIIDVGTKEGLRVGNMVFALGDVPIGRISEVYTDSAKVVLFSNKGEVTQVVISPSLAAPGKSKNIFMEVVGRGGGNFEMVIERDLTLAKGDQVVLPGITPSVLAIVQTIISDPRDPFVKALLTSPVNIQEIKFVEVENSTK